MNTTVSVFAALLACLIIAGCVYWYAVRPRTPTAKLLPLSSASHRELSDAEQAAIKKYLSALEKLSANILSAEADISPIGLMLTSQSNHVYRLTRAITRYGFSTEFPHEWRYYLDEKEVHLPPLWEQYITDENCVELIKAHPVSLIISLNGHTLVDYDDEQPVAPSTLCSQTPCASIRKQEGERIDLLRFRQETEEEYRLSHSSGVGTSLVISSAYLLFFLSLISTQQVMMWLIGTASFIVALSCGFFYSRPSKKALREIHCLRGTPRRWEIFSESFQGQNSNISLGIIDLIYPAHWLPYVNHDLGQATAIDIYPNRQVVRQGKFLSLRDEERQFPLQLWRNNAVLACSSLLILMLLASWAPLSMPLTLSVAWIKGTESIQVTNVKQLEKLPLRVGDTLQVSGTGMCSVPASYNSNRIYSFKPFDCSAIYWNDIPPPAQPRSDIIEKASSLQMVTQQMLHPQSETERRLNPQLATAIQKSGMILLDDFSDLVQRTRDLCGSQLDCVRLKNALVNLGNAKDWEALVSRARSGSLTGMNVLLRPVSADALGNLVNNATTTFFYRETQHAIEALSSLPHAGFMIVSNDHHLLVDQPPPAVPLADYSTSEQWNELQRLASLLLQTPFNASGIITSITTDANGTRHVKLAGEPTALSLWHHLATSLLLLILSISVVLNTLLVVKRIYRNRSRIAKIQRYYDRCFHQDSD